MLDVDGGDDGDARVQEFEHVLVALAVLRAGGVRVRQLVNDGDRGPAADDRPHVQLFEGDAAVLQLARGDALQVADARGGLRAPVRLDEGDDDVHALALEVVRLFEHLVGLANAGGRADVDAQPRPLALLELGE